MGLRRKRQLLPNPSTTGTDRPTASSLIWCSFAGAAINRIDADGPYRLQNVSIARTSGSPLSMYWHNVYTSAAYTADQFAP